MRIAIISDIHSNLTALLAVLKDIKIKGVDRIFCLGDIVGYGPRPKECLALVEDRADIIIKGNHEEGVADEIIAYQFNDRAWAGIKFSRDKLNAFDCENLKALPSKMVVKDIGITLAHGSYTEPSIWNYVEKEEDVLIELRAIETDICFVGHTHVPLVFGSVNGLYEILPEDMALDRKQKHFINVGSVGQPRDGDCRASYGLLTAEKIMRFDLIRVPYDIEATYKEIKEAKLPISLGERLFMGI